MSASPSAEDEYLHEHEPDPEPDVPGVSELILALECLTAKQRFVIELRYGLRGEEPYTQREIAELMGVHHHAVERLEERAIARMQRAVEGVGKTSPM